MRRLKNELDDKALDILLEEAFRIEQDQPEPEELPPETIQNMERVKGRIQKTSAGRSK